MNLFSYYTIFFLLILPAYGFFAQSESSLTKKSPFILGETIQLHSAVLQEDRALNIYLPDSYASNTSKSYPVIYLLDGSRDEDFIHIAGLVQFGTFSWINMLPESIVVGIGNVDRKRDFTFPTTIEKDLKDFPTTGKSENFIRFIEQELIPFIKTQYRTDSVSTIIGQSLGGLLATEILLEQPGLFDNYIIVSQSLLWDIESLLKMELKNFTGEKHIYIAVGKEGEIMERTAKALYEKLKQPANNNLHLYFEFLEHLDHGDALHLAVYHAFEKIFHTAAR